MKQPKTPNPQVEPPRGLSRITSSIGTVTVSLALGGAVALAIGLVIFIFFHEMRTISYAVMALGGLAILISFLASYRQAFPVITGRRSRFGVNTLIMTALFLGIAILVNYLVFNSNQRLDATSAKQFTLAPRTKELLKNLSIEIRATGFFRETDADQAVTKDQIDDYLYEFSRRAGSFSYRYVDPDTDPVAAKEYAVTKYQVVVFENMETGKRQTIAVPSLTEEAAGKRRDEERFVTALLIVTETQQKRIYFLTGHGERDTLDAETENGYWRVYNGLINDSYMPLTLNLLDQQDVPDDAAALIVAGPKKELLESEVTSLDKYLLRGGRILFLLDSNTPTSFRQFVENWGVKVLEGRIFDLASSVGGDPKIPLLQREQFTTDVPRLTGAMDVAFFPEATAVSAAKETEEEMPTISYVALGNTTVDSWVVKDATQDKPISGDPRGPFAIGAVVVASEPITLPADLYPSGKYASIIVIGDSDFAANRYYYAFTNSDLFLGSVNWLTEDYALISIRPKPSSFRELVLTTRERDFFRYSTWFLLPIAMLGLAGIVWWRRR